MAFLVVIIISEKMLSRVISGYVRANKLSTPLIWTFLLKKEWKSRHWRTSDIFCIQSSQIFPNLASPTPNSIYRMTVPNNICCRTEHAHFLSRNWLPPGRFGVYEEGHSWYNSEKYKFDGRWVDCAREKQFSTFICLFPQRLLHSRNATATRHQVIK